MKHINELTEEEIKGLNLVVFDVDGVIVPRGTKIKEDIFSVSMNLKYPPQEFIETARKLLKYTNIAISSGRSMLTLKTMFAELVGEEINGHHFILQAENGGRISWGADEIPAGHNPEVLKTLARLKAKLREIQKKDERFFGFEPKETILTAHCKEPIIEIEKAIEGYPLYIIWSGEAYDIGDPNITKGTGLLRIKNEIKKRQNKEPKAIAIGDRLNDLDLLQYADISVSADPSVLRQAHYYVPESSETLPGIVLAKKLLQLFKKQSSN